MYVDLWGKEPMSFEFGVSTFSSSDESQFWIFDSDAHSHITLIICGLSKAPAFRNQIICSLAVKTLHK